MNEPVTNGNLKSDNDMQNDNVDKKKALSIFEMQCRFYNNRYKAYISLSEENKEIIKSIYPNIINKPEKITIKREKANYYSKCWEFTEYNAPILEGIEKREFKKYDIDHIVPISYGYKNNIPAELIGSIENLRIISNKENLIKNNKITEDAIKILDIWKKKKLI